MSYSNSSLNCFQNCMKLYEHRYILHTPPCKPPSIHLEFGTMAHEVLYKAGVLRDECRDGVSDDQYRTIIPSEVLYPHLKQEFQIKTWDHYFRAVIKRTAEQEAELISELGEPCELYREHKFVITIQQLQELGYDTNDGLTGVIDLLIVGQTKATIIDYKFSTTKKGQDEFDQNSQLQLYAMAVHLLYDIPLHNIRIGYIDIPKKDFGFPTLLSNGTLSRAASQNCSAENYEKAVIAVHGEDDPVYHCREGGYYYDIYNKLKLNSPAYLVTQWLDLDAYSNITDDLINTACVITKMRNEKMPFLRKYDTYSCGGCEYLDSCKPWRKVQW